VGFGVVDDFTEQLLAEGRQSAFPQLPGGFALFDENPLLRGDGAGIHAIGQMVDGTAGDRVTIKSVSPAISRATTSLGSACTVTSIPAARAAVASRSSASATTTLMMSTPCWRSVLNVVTPKWRDPTRVIRMMLFPSRARYLCRR